MCNNLIKNLKALKSITIILVIIQKVNRNQIKTNKMTVNNQIVNNIQIVNQNNILNLKISNIFNKNPKFQILIFLNLFKIYKKIQ